MTRAANTSAKPKICKHQMTHETILRCARLQNNVSMARKMQPWQNTGPITGISLHMPFPSEQIGSGSQRKSIGQIVVS